MGGAQMSYIKAMDVLPKDLICRLQDYVDGTYIYIPRKEGNKKAWGEKTDTKKEIALRNREIYRRFKTGDSVRLLSVKYYLSLKSIQKILAKARMEEE
jgi:Mor family transcriptional regulator